MVFSPLLKRTLIGLGLIALLAVLRHKPWAGDSGDQMVELTDLGGERERLVVGFLPVT